MKSDHYKKLILPFFLVALLCMLFSFYMNMNAGLTWDEPFYIISGMKHWKWLNELSLESFSRANIYSHWQINHEHPPLAKIGFGALSHFFSGFLGIITSSRLFSALLFGVLCGSLYVFCIIRYSSFVGLASIFILVMIPRYIGYTFLATLDFPLSVFFFLTMLFYFLGTKKRLFFILAVIFFAISNLIKFNALFALLPIILWGFIYDRKLLLKKIIVMLLTSILALIFFWPWMYHDTRLRLKDYFFNKVFRTKADTIASMVDEKDLIRKKTSIVPVYYFNKTYKREFAPWHYSPVIFFTTTPIFILLFFLYGVYIFFRKRKYGSFEALCLMNIFSGLFIWCLPVLPKYGGIRYFFHIYPFLAILAAIGVSEAFVYTKKYFNNAVYVFVPVFIYLLFIIFSQKNQNHLYYNRIVGGLKGADRLGLPFENLGFQFDDEVMEFINEKLPVNSIFTLHPSGAFVKQLYGTLGGFRGDLKIVMEYNEADFLVLFPYKSFFDPYVERLYNDDNALWERKFNGFSSCKIVANSKKDIKSKKILHNL